jgi:murein DD-endopeptidase MepM/ murein hydrolase activator NlpD
LNVRDDGTHGGGLVRKKTGTAPAIIACLTLLVIVLLGMAIFKQSVGQKRQEAIENKQTREIIDTVKSGETLFDIFRKNGLAVTELFKMKEADASVHHLGAVQPGQPYRIILDDKGVRSLDYWIDDDFILKVDRSDDGFCVKKSAIDYDRRTLVLEGTIEDNLIGAFREVPENVMLALELSDIYSWDIDFSTDLRRGDTFRIVVEAYYLDGVFKKYGQVLAAQFTNNGHTYRVYRFESNGAAAYYDEDGRSLKKAFLKAPLSFRRISSGFTTRRLHPILKIFRPHHGLDYAAPTDTPVSAVGEGTVIFAGKKGQYGRLVIIRHPNGWETCYGHLSRIAKGVVRGRRIGQGEVIGSVGSSGLTTGPHLHYEDKINSKPVNPLKLNMPRGGSVTPSESAHFRQIVAGLDARMDKDARILAMSGSR